MAVQNPGVLTPDELNDTDEEVLDVLHEGRVTPMYVAGLLDVSRTYASERLKRLVEHKHVEKLASGLYELVDDPREEGQPDEADLRARLQNALEARDDAHARVDRLEDELQDCRELLDDARGTTVDAEALRHALDDVEAAAQNGNGNGLQDALRRAREAIGDGD